MTFQNYACWQPEMVSSVMNPVAEDTSDAIFLVTHHSVSMYREELIEATSRVPYDEERFLKDFLALPDFAFVSVIGTYGTGKSHLIRWLATQIKKIVSPSKARIIRISRIGTNLKNIIRIILQDMEGKEFEEYRTILDQTRSTLKPTEAREQLLNRLAEEVGPNGSHDPTKLSIIQHELIDQLPALLYDPFFRKHLLQSDGIIDRLVNHILGQRNLDEAVDEPRRFTINDLPIKFSSIKEASGAARNFYRELVDDEEELQPATVQWLNDHLDRAITKVLNFGRGDLQRLMIDVRRALARRGIELILLIEDFSLLQGIEREVLDAILVRPHEIEGETLCNMRTALACTTGYFKTLPDTVRSRADFRVNLDIETIGSQSLVTQDNLQQFVAKYLNAVRLSKEEIENWADQQNEVLPTACTNCPHCEPCHAGFGQVDGMGLYPFTSAALSRMYQRVSQGSFNPRVLLRNVLRHTLEYHRSELETGRFPSVSLLEHFGGSKLNQMLLNKIEQSDPQNYERRKVLIDLWTEGKELCNLPAEVHTAFELPPLTGVESIERPEIIQIVKESQTKLLVETDSLPAELLNNIEALNQWGNGIQLSQEVAQKLRSLIFDAINYRIDWDAELLLYSSSSVKPLFDKSRNINFRNAATSSQVKGVELLLPINESEVRDTAIALQAILLYNHYENWKLPSPYDGAEYFRIYARQLEQWSQFILEQIRNRARWGAVDAAVELLVIGARMAGCNTNSTEDLVNALFVNFEDIDISFRASTWQKLFKAFQTQSPRSPKLLEIVKAHIPCTKGGSMQLQIIDTSQLLTRLLAIRNDWRPNCDIPENLPFEFESIRKVREQVDNLLDDAVREERQRQLVVYHQMIDELGDNPDAPAIVDSIQEAIEQVRDKAGVSGLSNLEPLSESLKAFKKAPLKNYVEAMNQVQKAEDIGRLLRLLSSDYQKIQKASGTISNFLKISRDFIDSSRRKAEKEIKDLEGAGGEELTSSQEAIQQSLSDLEILINDIKDLPVCS